ncbi:hypothetical protein ACFQER_16750 [Halomicroarcula sp. GCM10025894]|uniref:hypothetical protein n=1 Tax=Halomicroarcula sp. GCM10025894 TaxID=3252673 RepID=UPI003616ECFE
MATIDSGERSPLAGFRVTGQTLLMVGFTLVQTLTLGLWLTLVADAPPISAPSAVGLGVLTIGLVVEHVLTDATVNGVSASALPGKQALVVSGSEALLWVLWLGVAQRLGGVDGILAAGALFSVLLVPLHTVEDNVLRGVAPSKRSSTSGPLGSASSRPSGRRCGSCSSSRASSSVGCSRRRIGRCRPVGGRPGGAGGHPACRARYRCGAGESRLSGGLRASGCFCVVKFSRLLTSSVISVYLSI